MQLKWSQEIIFYSIKRPANLVEIANEFNTKFGTEEKQLCCECVFEVIASDNKITTEEKEFIKAVTDLLNIDPDYKNY